MCPGLLLNGFISRDERLLPACCRHSFGSEDKFQMPFGYRQVGWLHRHVRAVCAATKWEGPAPDWDFYPNNPKFQNQPDPFFSSTFIPIGKLFCLMVSWVNITHLALITLWFSRNLRTKIFSSAIHHDVLRLWQGWPLWPAASANRLSTFVQYRNF